MSLNCLEKQSTTKLSHNATTVVTKWCSYIAKGYLLSCLSNKIVAHSSRKYGGSNWHKHYSRLMSHLTAWCQTTNAAL